jgi:penicillin-binding protein A
VFADLAIQLGAQPIGATAAAFGFDRPFDLPWTTAESTFPEAALRNDAAALGQSGIGERDVRATPLQMAVVAAAIANQGEAMRPYVVRQIFNADGVTERIFDPVVEGRALSPAAASVMTDMMERVVTNGTGGRASVPGVRVAGKTGTAQGTGGAPEAWFIGFAPVENPSIAIAVLVEDGGGSGEDGTGGSVAAPIAAELIRLWLAR